MVVGVSVVALLPLFALGWFVGGIAYFFYTVGDSVVATVARKARGV